MKYLTAQAFRTALEDRLLRQSVRSGLDLNRLRRRVLFDRVLARLVAVEPGQWVLKGGVALEIRLGDQARTTKDVDLGLRTAEVTGAELHERILNAVIADPDQDYFNLRAEPPTQLRHDDAGHVTWRMKIEGQLAGKLWDRVQVDVSPRPHELEATDLLPLPGILEFAGIAPPTVEIVDVNRHAAEKLHGMTRDFRDRENTRVRDLVDLVALIEHDQIDPALVAHAVTKVWAERDGATPPVMLPELPLSWSARYPQLIPVGTLAADTFLSATALVAQLWTEMFPAEEI